MKRVEKLIEIIFSGKWTLMTEASIHSLKLGNYPGIYVIAYSTEDLENKQIVPEHIFYVGISNAKKGVKSRLKQFKRATGKIGYKHNAGNRFRYQNTWSNRSTATADTQAELFFYALTFASNPSKKERTEKDLRILGNICQLEYYLLAYVKQLTGNEPMLNAK